MVSGIAYQPTRTQTFKPRPEQQAAIGYARRVAEHLQYVGVFALELFDAGDRLLANEKVQMHWNSRVVDLAGEGNLESVTLEDTVTGEYTELPASGLFVAIGHEPRSAVVSPPRTPWLRSRSRRR